MEGTKISKNLPKSQNSFKRCSESSIKEIWQHNLKPSILKSSTWSQIFWWNTLAKQVGLLLVDAHSMSLESLIKIRLWIIDGINLSYFKIHWKLKFRSIWKTITLAPEISSMINVWCAGTMIMRKKIRSFTAKFVTSLSTRTASVKSIKICNTLTSFVWLAKLSEQEKNQCL